MCVKLQQAQKPKPKDQRLTSVKPIPQKPFQYQGYFLDRFENVSNLNLKSKQSADTEQKLHCKEHAGQPGAEDKWSQRDMEKTKRNMQYFNFYLYQVF